MDDPQKPEVTQPRTKSKNTKIALAIGVAIAVIGGASIAITQSNAAKEEAAIAELEKFRQEQLPRAATSCHIKVDQYDKLDDGNAVRFDAATKRSGATAGSVYCFLKELGAPETIESKIGQTRALDGTQTAQWNEFEATWTYHPDDGLNLLVERVGEPSLAN